MYGSPEQRIETVIVGGGQAGLSVGYHLKRLGRPFVILDSCLRIGDSWRTRCWRSLRLFTPARYDGLPGWSFPAHPWSCPTKDDLADYLEDYAARFELPVRTGVTVDGLFEDDGAYVITSGELRFEADNVVVASGTHRSPIIPAFADELDPRILQLHSSEYRDPSQLREGDVLVVGAGNSGADIALELSAGRRTLLSGPDKGYVPLRIESRLARVVLPVLWFLASRVLTVKTPLGRKVRPHVLSQGSPLIRVKPQDLADAGVERVPRTVEVRDGFPVLEDGRILDVANAIWCTGFRPDFSWIDLPVFDEEGEPLYERGVVASQPGLYFLGLNFLYAFTSENVGGVGRDAGYIAKTIASGSRNGRVDDKRAAVPAPAR